MKLNIKSNKPICRRHTLDVLEVVLIKFDTFEHWRKITNKDEVGTGYVFHMLLLFFLTVMADLLYKNM